MAAKKKVKAKAQIANYGEMHKSLKGMSRQELIEAIQHEIDQPEPRRDMVTRLIGRLNKVTGRHAMSSILALLSKKGARDVNAALASDG